MVETAIQASAGLCLMLLAALVDPNANFRSRLLFRFVPVVIGTLSLANAYARFMGWL